MMTRTIPLLIAAALAVTACSAPTAPTAAEPAPALSTPALVTPEPTISDTPTPEPAAPTTEAAPAAAPTTPAPAATTTAPKATTTTKAAAPKTTTTTKAAASKTTAAAPPPAPVAPPAGTGATPATSDTWQACSTSLGGATVNVAARQRSVTVVNGNGGSYATMSFWVRDDSPCGFVNVFTDSGSRIGANGITNGATRQQGTNTTPSGTYTMTEAFGLNSSPGTSLLYRRAGAGDFWVEDNNSAYYNSFRNVSQGGFDASLPVSDPNGSERLTNYPSQYGYSIVVNFNRAPDFQKPYRGAGIFVHVRTGATAGCISTSSANVVTMLRMMRSGDTITIVA